MDNPTTLIAFFESRQTVIDAVNQLAKMELVDISKAAVVARAESGETVLVDNKVKPLEGRRAGMRLGAVMTALGFAQLGAFALPGIGPIIAIVAGALMGGLVGGATGQFAATLISFGFRKDQIDALSEHLNASEIALIIHLEDPDQIPQLRAELHNFTAEILEASGQRSQDIDFSQLPRREHQVTQPLKTRL
ncbi:MAG TPA: hypothetical protein VJZ27_20915 [Aggregatilineales bacterium]|nr:hypothetical protein [Aggregatilineales bacterium]